MRHYHTKSSWSARSKMALFTGSHEAWCRTRCSWAYQAGITHDSLTRIPFMVISPWLSPIMLKFSYHSDILNLFLAHRSQAKAMNPYPTDPYGHPPRGMGYRESIRDPYNLKVRNVNQPRYHSRCVTATLELIFASLELAVLESTLVGINATTASRICRFTCGPISRS